MKVIMPTPLLMLPVMTALYTCDVNFNKVPIAAGFSHKRLPQERTSGNRRACSRRQPQDLDRVHSSEVPAAAMANDKSAAQPPLQAASALHFR
jgi:hypothetical protein